MAPLSLALIACLALQPAQAFRSKPSSSVASGCPSDSALNVKGQCIDAKTYDKVEDSCCDLFKTCEAGLEGTLADLNARLALYFGGCGVTKDDLQVDTEGAYHMVEKNKVCSEECQDVPALSDELETEFEADQCGGFSALEGKMAGFKMMEGLVGNLDGTFKACTASATPENIELPPPATPENIELPPLPCDGQVFTTVQYDAVDAAHDALSAGIPCERGSCTCGPNPNGHYPVEWEATMLYPNKAGYYPSIYGYYPNIDGCIPSPFGEDSYPDENMVYPRIAGFSGSGKQPEEAGYDACGVVHKVDEWGQQK